MPKVSVIIPCFNPGSHIDSAIESVLAQTFHDWELILIDDGSTEDLSCLQKKYTAVTILRQKNSGQSVARNLGIQSSSGEFIAFLDQDDLWMPTKLERQLAVLEADSSLGFCHTQFDFIDQSGKKTGDGFGRLQSYDELLRGSGICGSSTVMVRRTCLSVGLFDQYFQPAEDYELWLRLSQQFKLGFVESCEASYRIHQNNQTRDYFATHAAMVKILEKHRRLALAGGDLLLIEAANAGLGAVNKTFAAQAFDQCRLSFKKRDFASLIRHFAFAITKAPVTTASQMAAWTFAHRRSGQ